MFQALEGKGPTIAETEPQPVDVLDAEKPESVSSEPNELATVECPNCHTLNCSVVECCACGRLGCRITSVTCPYHRHGARVQHQDGSYGDVAPHMTQCSIEDCGETVLVNGQKYSVGTAPGAGNNCLVFSLAQCLRLQEVDAATVRLKLVQMHPKGEAKVTKSNFLTAEFHWHSLLGADPTEYTVVVLNDSRKQGACHGHGPKQIVIENLGNQHFQPLLLSA